MARPMLMPAHAGRRPCLRRLTSPQPASQACAAPTRPPACTDTLSPMPNPCRSQPRHLQDGREDRGGAPVPLWLQALRPRRRPDPGPQADRRLVSAPPCRLPTAVAEPQRRRAASCVMFWPPRPGRCLAGASVCLLCHLFEPGIPRACCACCPMVPQVHQLCHRRAPAPGHPAHVSPWTACTRARAAAPGAHSHSHSYAPCATCVTLTRRARIPPPSAATPAPSAPTT